MSRDSLNSIEIRAISGLAGLYGLRMLGLFMVLPVMPLLLEDFDGATPLAIGLAIGIYGFTQALLQLPFGWLSDRWGRKPLIYLGLAVFALGSLVAATADSLVVIILGRALQGMGAIASVLMALLADLTRDERRTQAMASVGISIGLAFILAMALGPWLAQGLGLSGLFWLTLVLSLLGMLVLWRWVPSPAKSRKHLDAGIDLKQLTPVISHPQLLRLDFSILLLHLLLTAIFIAVPGLLLEAGWSLAQQGFVYLGCMLLGFVFMIPLIIYGEKKRQMKRVLLAGFALLALGLALLVPGGWWLLPGLWIFFIGFNLLEASLPSLISKQAPVESKGTAMGVYSTSQFMGAFAGGILGGWLLGGWGAEGLLWVAAAACLLWLLGLLGFQPPRHLSSRVFHLSPQTAAEGLDELEKNLKALPGVEEVVFLVEEATGYLKLDRQQLDEDALEELLAETSG
ncbi:Predicted arabinose efflux permease, MFS family [Marinospirillum celere]|uniref:Predicted arabinose efflux permease, MFS family n=1 Tax=Marinospirillum celere TaxID=1122252 RepID=A0A1I1JP89_9GAMM|nr:MFS transporter [Marinospirillum celere]SFC47703.1 Predicted arabinose efflux permease, MFS family [Marinospirillum celere]